MTEKYSVSLVVEAGAVSAFRVATGLPRDEHATYAPPTFPVVVEHAGRSFASLLSGEGIDLRRVLHGEERLEYPSGPLRVGEHLEGEMWLSGDETRQGGEGSLRLMTVHMDLRRSNGQLAVSVDRVMVVLEDREMRPAG